MTRTALYRRLVDEVLDEVKPIVERRDPGMCYRAGWIFVSSPGAVTPFHMDHEHNFILQIRGNKRLYTWDPFDREVVSERAQELFHDQHSRELIMWNEAWRARARVFDLEPGLGGYMPSTQLRRLGIEPHPVGASRGRGVRDTGLAYAPPQRNNPAAGRTDAM